MRQLTNITAVKHIALLLSLIFLAICFNAVLVSAEENGSEAKPENELVGDMLNNVKDAMAQQKKRKKALEAFVRKPLTETQQELLRQLLQHTGTLDEILSSAPYLAYLKTEIGKEYKDFPAYVEAMPTPKQKTAILFSFKEALPSKTEAEALAICTDYYFKLRLRLIKEPEFLVKMNALVAFQTEHLMEPLMAIYPATELFSHMSELTQMAMVTNLRGQMHTEVFHDVWQEHLKKYGSSEGLLRSALTTPAEFALVRSFFEDTTAFEKWIQPPSEPEEAPETEKTDR